MAERDLYIHKDIRPQIREAAVNPGLAVSAELDTKYAKENNATFRDYMQAVEEHSNSYGVSYIARDPDTKKMSLMPSTEYAPKRT